MRSLRPAPKVALPRPPLHLFEPNQDSSYSTGRNDKPTLSGSYRTAPTLTTAADDDFAPSPVIHFEDDVKNEMMKLEREMMELLLQEEALKESHKSVTPSILSCDNSATNIDQINATAETGLPDSYRLGAHAHQQRRIQVCCN